MIVRWHDHNAKDNPPFLDALAKARDIAVKEGYCYHHVQAIIVSIDQYAEAVTGNRQYFQNPPHTAGSSRRVGDIP